LAVQNSQINVTKTSTTNNNDTNSVCVVFNNSQSSDVQLYIRSIDGKI